MATKEKLAQKLGCSFGSKKAYMECLRLLMASDEVSKTELKNILQYITEMNPDSAQFVKKMFDLVEQDEQRVDAREELEEAVQDQPPMTLASYAEHVQSQFHKATPCFQAELLQAIQTKDAHNYLMLEEARCSEDLLKKCLPRLELEAYIQNSTVLTREAQIERNKLREDLVDVIINQAVPKLADLLSSLSKPAKLLEDQQLNIPVVQHMGSSTEAYEAVLEQSRALHVKMLEVVSEHCECTKTTLSEALAGHVTHASEIIRVMQAFLEHIKAEIEKEACLQGKLLQEREKSLSQQCKAYIDANVSPSKDSAYKDALERLSSVQDQKQELGQKEQELTGLLDEVVDARLKLTKLEETLVTPKSPPAKKRRFAWWGS